jgi:3-hydroxyisobutyrate dehydrogenase-like beta-hydroxyacid dehydrogenase
MGAMGSRMTTSLLNAGHAVTVWNRAEARTQPLIEQGATLAKSPRVAAEGSEFVLAMVRDDAASRDVWLSPTDGALPAMSSDQIGIESSTLSTAWLGDLSAAFAARGVPFLDAPVVGTRAQADAKTLIHLVGGEADLVAKAQPVFSAIGGAAHHVGPSGSGTALKLVVNSLLGIQIAALGELLAAAERMGLDRRRAGEVLVELPACSSSAKGATLGMLARNFAPAFPVELIAKDFGYMLSDMPTAAAPLTTATRAVFERALGAGLGSDNMTAIVKLYDAPRGPTFSPLFTSA